MWAFCFVAQNSPSAVRNVCGNGDIDRWAVSPSRVNDHDPEDALVDLVLRLGDAEPADDSASTQRNRFSPMNLR